jgi:type II secretory ATPase GspE/PulE/Tfp pilus assembly ATPase PilB-like protein
MDLTEKRRPADGRWIYNRTSENAVDLRINAIPTLYGEDFALRLLTRGNKIYAIENLGMTREQLQSYTQMYQSPSGLILITGPTGSGKTATLYSTLIKLNDGKRKINTIEDPIEYAIDGLRQSQINTAIDLSFKELLRSVLRQSPDVIMIGEVRDEETARTAVHAANSGILVFATLHAPHAAGAIQSMRALNVHSHFLASSLRGVVSQRLVRTLDPATKVGFDLTDAPHTFDEVRKWLGPDEGRKLYAAKPAESNLMTGYAGRTGIFEMMSVTKEIRNLISDGAPSRTIRDKAIEQNMLEFRQSAMLKVARGETSTEEIFRVVPTETLLVDE